MRQLIALCALALAGTSAYGSIISVNAVIGCSQSCVTVAVSWADLAYPVYSAEVDDPLGNTLFTLNVPSPAVRTGSILPNPQTAYGISASTVHILTDPGILNLYGQDNVPDGSVSFVATFEQATPEPGGWILVTGGLGLILAYSVIRRRAQLRLRRLLL